MLGLPDAERYVVVLVDGLGWHLVRGAIRDAPYLASLLGDGRPITAGRAQHHGDQPGLAGHRSAAGTARDGRLHVAGALTGEILNALTWESDLVARSYQPRPTLFERAARPGSPSARWRWSGSSSAA